MHLSYKARRCTFRLRLKRIHSKIAKGEEEIGPLTRLIHFRPAKRRVDQSIPEVPPERPPD